MSPFDRRLLAALEPGLAIEPQPYERLAETLGVDQSVVLDRLDGLQDEGTISRFGVVVRHHELGYRANAMVVWGRAGPAGRGRPAGSSPICPSSPCVTADHGGRHAGPTISSA